MVYRTNTIHVIGGYRIRNIEVIALCGFSSNWRLSTANLIDFLLGTSFLVIFDLVLAILDLYGPLSLFHSSIPYEHR